MKDANPAISDFILSRYDTDLFSTQVLGEKDNHA